MFHFSRRDCCYIKSQSQLVYCNVRSMKRNFGGSTPTSECTKVSNKRQKNQNTRMGQSESGYVASKDFETRSDACSGQQSAVPLAVVEEILLNLPAHQVVQVCRLVCHEWKELVDSAAHWRERCRTEGLQPYDASRPPEDWRLFYFLSKFRRNLLKNPRAEDGLQGWEIVQNGADRWVTERNSKPFPDNTVTRCFVTSHGLCLKEQLIDLKKEGYSDAFMDQLRPRIKISDWYIPPSGYRSHYTLYVQFLDQEKNPIRTCHPYNYFRQQGSDYPWCQITYVFRDYGPGVQFIRFTHGGMGWSGIRVTNSSVEICPAAERWTSRVEDCT
ncbi:F-box only protein 44-like isoform X2 [Cyprinus carpio]|uniref:F-box only protein 44-like isoform X2 n=1 Tax=Cyprinus carpio TaxID=7962 RepID=A0A9Q9WJB2_CYPCA|nr:F-box only protein 44-like isoform X2 [Cyprinus carpio]